MADQIVAPGEARWLPWFSNAAERAVFAELGYGSVFLLGHEGSGIVRIAASSDPRRQLSLQQIDAWKTIVLHDLIWLPGMALCERVKDEVGELLDRHGRRACGDWFDVPPEMISRALRFSASRTGADVLDHPAMMARVREIREARIARALS